MWLLNYPINILIIRRAILICAVHITPLLKDNKRKVAIQFVYFFYLPILTD